MTEKNGSKAATQFSKGGLFIFDAEPVIEWPVRVRYPVEGGGVETATIPMMLRYRAMIDLADIEAKIAKLNPQDMGGEEDPLLDIVRSWRGVGRDGHEGAVPCDEKNKGLMLRRTNVRQALIMALREMALGAEAKNSETPPADGPNRAQRRAAAVRPKATRAVKPERKPTLN